MSNIELHLTIIQSQKLRNIVGMGKTAAYQISISRGATIGRSGFILDSNKFPTANHESWSSERETATGWLHRCLTFLNLRQD